MFKFGFSRNNEDEEKDIGVKKSTIDWIPASKVEVSELQIEKQYDPNDYMDRVIFPGCKLKLIRSEKALHDLKEENCINIIEAESQHSDLIPSKYEGGLKIWECSYDLAQYIFEKNIVFQDKFVLDLGCGTGVIGLIALLKNSIVHFQDYNVEVISTVTIPNVLLNFEDRESILKRCEFFCGDWESFTKLHVSSGENKLVEYDLIFTSETIYNPDNHKKLYEVFKQRLKQDGIGLIAAKSYYFGVGGGIRQFQNFIEEDGIFDVDVTWKSQDILLGLQREILKITRKTQLLFI
ncbi:Histidine protein methyltransferase 1 like protein [Habropoda laboriosa]|uniref:protein-histidine N-methyltransferase n=1 Tax=Habropoda laboriosa TaxID=597456 RepID=A0A0L7R3V6_9HYME|nr:PREDICTED: histidine protein methyltransferase 1 homolog [Habropoda laboriosa]KOC65533.1 Histidine protein methyltransferase 1 like protein [Habropoda laboriosa]